MLFRFLAIWWSKIDKPFDPSWHFILELSLIARGNLLDSFFSKIQSSPQITTLRAFSMRFWHLGDLWDRQKFLFFIVRMGFSWQEYFSIPFGAFFPMTGQQHAQDFTGFLKNSRGCLWGFYVSWLWCMFCWTPFFCFLFIGSSSIWSGLPDRGDFLQIIYA